MPIAKGSSHRLQPAQALAAQLRAKATPSSITRVYFQRVSYQDGITPRRCFFITPAQRAMKPKPIDIIAVVFLLTCVYMALTLPDALDPFRKYQYPNSHSQTQTWCALTFTTTDSSTSVFDYYATKAAENKQKWEISDGKLEITRPQKRGMIISANPQSDHQTKVTVRIDNCSDGFPP